jgi:DNA invertase Pin-like site-specific DNA recombinase
MKAFYIRTSRVANDGAAQLFDLKKWASTQEGWAQHKVYLDEGESGAKDKRPQWDKLRADIKNGMVDELVCTELSRIGRSVLNVVLSLDEIYRDGCRVVLLRQGLDYATAMGRAVATILAAIAQLEREQIRDRLVAGVRRAQSEGTRSGKPIGRAKKTITNEEIEHIKNSKLTLKEAVNYVNKRRDEPKQRVSKTTMRRAIATANKNKGDMEGVQQVI